MKNVKTIFVLSVICLVSCVPKKPIYTQQTSNNKDYKISYLFEHDGCKVYRFIDGLNTVYFTSCYGETSLQQDSTTIIRSRSLR